MNLSLVLELLAFGATVLAVVSTFIAWRVVKEEQRRSSARIANLAEAIRSTDDTAVTLRAMPGPTRYTEVARRSDRPRTATRVIPVADSAPHETEPDLFMASGAPRSGASQNWGLALVAGVVILAAAAAAVVIFNGESRTASVGRAPVARQVVAAPRPLELVALGHERDGDRLTIHGVVRNPGGLRLDGLTAVALLFGRDGTLVATERAPVQTPTLESEPEASFTIVVPTASAVARYRVSFRLDDRIVPHVDRRKTS